jgi:hypothetical protein
MYIGDYAGGPPHAMSKELVSGLLTAQGFEATYLEPVSPQLRSLLTYRGASFDIW